MDPELPLTQEPARLSRGKQIISFISHIWSPSRICHWPSSFPDLHQRPTRTSLVNHSSLCRRQSFVPEDTLSSRHQGPTRRPRQTPEVGTRLDDVLQPQQVRGDPSDQEEESNHEPITTFMDKT